ncbi:extracellular solute-binding protein [Aeromicrobium halocynthiae]|uniref:extracellular solute-binding protein n=1 Tax=Aeromicrobium halocynthiae TaxID=560557 RepID=UPI0031E1BEBF
MHRKGGVAVACALVLAVSAACGGAAAEQDEMAPELVWYTGPDRVDAEALARECTVQAAGNYTIAVESLPTDFDERHAFLVRRMLAEDDSIDLFTLDGSLTTEFSAARFLAPIPEDLKEPFAEDVFPAALLAASDGQQLVAAPWWYDPYLLWWAGATAERAGLDPSGPITWDQLLEGAERTGATIEIDDPAGNAVPVVLNALVEGAGGTMLDGQGRSPRVGLDTDAGRTAAEILRTVGDLGAGEPDELAPRRFAVADATFLLAPSSVVSDPALVGVGRELQWTAFPVVDEAAPPGEGAGLAVPLYAARTDLSYDAIRCLTSTASQRTLMLESGHGPARSTLYADEDVVAAYPLADVTEPSVRSAVTVPPSPYWARIRSALLETWEPLERIEPRSTPQASQDEVSDAVAGRLP